MLRAHVEAIHAVYNLSEFGPDAWYEAALDTCLETGMAPTRRRRRTLSRFNWPMAGPPFLS